MTMEPPTRTWEPYYPIVAAIYSSTVDRSQGSVPERSPMDKLSIFVGSDQKPERATPNYASTEGGGRHSEMAAFVFSNEVVLPGR
jgi:hypothetical protein